MHFFGLLIDHKRRLRYRIFFFYSLCFLLIFFTSHRACGNLTPFFSGSPEPMGLNGHFHTLFSIAVHIVPQPRGLNTLTSLRCTRAAHTHACMPLLWNQANHHSRLESSGNRYGFSTYRPFLRFPNRTADSNDKRWHHFNLT